MIWMLPTMGAWSCLAMDWETRGPTLVMTTTSSCLGIKLGPAPRLASGLESSHVASVSFYGNQLLVVRQA